MILDVYKEKFIKILIFIKEFYKGDLFEVKGFQV